MNVDILPHDENGLYRWIAALMVGYLAAAYLRHWRKDRELFPNTLSRDVLPKIFDSATFAVSAMLLLGVLNDDVLRAIGSVKPFLLVAALAGLLYAFHALTRSD